MESDSGDNPCSRAGATASVRGHRRNKEIAKRAGNREATFGERPSARQPHKKSNIPTGFREPPAEIAADRTSSEHQDAPLSVSPAGGRITEYNPTQD